MKLSNKIKKIAIFYLFLAVLMFLILAITVIKFKPKSYNIPALSLEDYVKIEKVEVQDQNILLTMNCYMLVMTTALEQTRSIYMVLENITLPRPDAHDLFAHTIKNLGISFLFVKIQSIKEGIYYSTIFLEQGQDILALDARPSYVDSGH